MLAHHHPILLIQILQSVMTTSRSGPLLMVILCSLSPWIRAQNLGSVAIHDERVDEATVMGKKYPLNFPIVSFQVKHNEIPIHQNTIKLAVSSASTFAGSLKVTVTFQNTTKDTISMANVVPFGEADDRVYLTGLGNHPLSRTHLFIPHKKPVNVIVPDNAWELGYAEATLTTTLHLCALARRDVSSIQQGKRKRFETLLFPGGSVNYFIYFDVYAGEWQEGLRKIFQEKMLYDVDPFDNSLFKRNDLAWIRKVYVMHLLMAWDKSYYDTETGKFNLSGFVRKGKSLYGGDD